MLIGNADKAELRLILPESWKSEPATHTSGLVSEGNSADFSFVAHSWQLSQPGFDCRQAVMKPPFDALIARINRDFPESAEGMIASVKAWPAETKRYADIAFALFADESFYPLTGDMWLAYEDSLSPEESGFRGPSYYEDTLISAHQAQTDVEMFDKLQNVLKTDPGFAGKLAESGIDIVKKRQDMLNSLYVLAVKSCRRYPEAAGFIEQLEKLLEEEKGRQLRNLKISVANLKGISFWSQSQKRPRWKTLSRRHFMRIASIRCSVMFCVTSVC